MTEYRAETWALKKEQENELVVAEMRGDKKLDRIRNLKYGDNKSGRNRKDRPGKEVEVVWTCDEKKGALRGKERYRWKYKGDRRKKKPKRKWLDKVRDDIKKKGLSADEVYDHAIWRLMSSYIDPT